MPQENSFPKIYLAIDNCVASKRWSVPADWMNLFADYGVSLVEASADNEIDPLYTEPGYLRDWAEDVLSDATHTGVRVVNLYSGHGTYTTLGLAHPDIRIREKIHHQWLEKMVDLAAYMGTGLGFFCHAFDQRTLNSPERYAAAYKDLVKRFSELAEYADEKGVESIGVEQMYSPHQIPWTVVGANNLVRDCFAVNRKNFYLTIDTGHQIGQKHFAVPDDGALKAAFEQIRIFGRAEGVYLGSAEAEKAIVDGALKGNSDRMLLEISHNDRNRYPWLYAPAEDGDVYRWISNLGAYSPIIHLQQTDGLHSSHEPFRIEDDGDPAKKINGKQLLQALKTAYDRPPNPNMPAPCRKIFLTLELFAGTAELASDIKNKIEDSVRYWRQFIPRDGQPLDVLADKFSDENLRIY